MKLELLVLLAGTAVCAFAGSSEEPKEFPAMLGLLGTKLDLGDALYDETSSDDLDSSEDSAEQKSSANGPCCFPDVWQGRVYGDFGIASIRGRDKPRVSRSLSEVFIDGPNKRVANNLIVGDGSGKFGNISYILQIGANSTGDLYIFDRKAQKCRHRQMPGAQWKRQCIPANATAGGQYPLGPGTGGLTVESWMFEGGSERVDSLVTSGDHNGPQPKPGRRPRLHIAANVLVVPGACIPVVIQEEGSIFIGDSRDDNQVETSLKPKPAGKPRGKAFAGSAYFSNMQVTISDPKVFDVPSYCQKASNSLYYDEMEDVLPSTLERFLIL